MGTIPQSVSTDYVGVGISLYIDAPLVGIMLYRPLLSVAVSGVGIKINTKQQRTVCYTFVPTNSSTSQITIPTHNPMLIILMKLKINFIYNNLT